MEPQYSIVADALSKFQTASEPIQALLVIVTGMTMVGIAAVVMRGLVTICRPPRERAIEVDGRFTHVADARLMPPTPVIPGPRSEVRGAELVRRSGAASSGDA